MEQFTVQLNNATCTVCIGAGVLGRAGALLRQRVPQVRRWALAADENVSALYGEWVQSSLRAAGLQVRLFPLPQGESAKTPEAWLSLCRRILDSGFDRSCGVVTLGGGACGDAAGFAGAIHRLMEDESLYRQFSADALRKISEEFDLEKLAWDVYRAYQ